MLTNNRLTPRTYETKKSKLDLYFKKEKSQLVKEKKDIKKGWQSTKDAIQHTERDFKFLQQQLTKYGILNERSLYKSQRISSYKKHFSSPKFTLSSNRNFGSSLKQISLFSQIKQKELDFEEEKSLYSSKKVTLNTKELTK